MQKHLILLIFLMLITNIYATNDSFSAESIEGRSQSRFRYEDEKKLPDHRYDKPLPADDLTALEISELRKRLIGVEERLEILERQYRKASEGK